ncbi:4-phosphopantoate--beta-alanine ligase [Methanococcus maripaludis]|uniref:4-phosphopantoate--beta-alanine ligase n=1 Tax=Methanococcus maripaludis TaxID=39152 RepID=A0A7J9PQ81_METMI|nr:4-phosphopantoate--beta-alanine ligase [Methanococcus maripaludis]MBA2868266.1 4-phosphopantoate--beta-alanine ligase [Methanococcus maripaludis]
MMVPESHPRYKSLLNRDRIVEAFESGVLAKGGMIAHGRGETFDYLIGESTTDIALNSIKVSAALLVLAENPVISVNGNSVALAKDEFVELAKELNGKIEVNLFYRTTEREEKIKDVFESDIENGIVLLGIDNADKQIPGIDHLRGKVSESGIYTSDVVLVPLEDGDRAEALVKMGKTVIAIDLNPLSRTARKSTISIIDELTRCIPLITEYVREYKKIDSTELLKIVENYDNEENLRNILNLISKRLTSVDLI